ncbi:Spermatogenesis-associated protein 5-like protein 1,Cell division cycle protein 48 homolog MJ1156,Cell division control protein 48 homolog B,ATPase family gene 2 protein,ATPase family protein 2 homolog,Proteasome-activating nucleotidase [Mytilus coruscus]|uniref:AAA+ ATPase domain-containing protein n=1 Tax=Mytilus coruscus TaxID=42192 RepID=A0A6J8BA58_MYTCO|nr:Spermatogenesis-associated protein 5-like protein 1,Cell division cycle protein 48 homolog MJ1156,Cell division control protein 48 homolog B,ATPase family gene 2 protein,ATPase family protein 2 homolog,Proteasome-activating nucleotidase [Mytilus coruscus]
MMHVCVREDQSQKCWIHPATLSQLNGELTSYFMISTSDSDFICQVWPNDQISTNCLSFSNSVFKNKSAHDSCNVNNYGDAIHMKTTNSKSLKLTLIVEDHQIIKLLKHDLKIHPSKVENMCKNLLYKYCVAEEFTVSVGQTQLGKIYGIYYILINSCEDENYDGFIINQQTEILVDCIVSKERFLQNIKPPDIGGLEKEARELCDILSLPFQGRSLISGEFKKVLPKGILLRGPPGTGKTSLVKHVGSECNAYIITVNSPEVFGARPGETEENLNKILDKALTFNEEGRTILFLDEVDTLCPDRRHLDGQKEINLTKLLVDFFDRITSNENIMVIGATNRPVSVDNVLRRPGRFDKEIMINVPNESQRLDILKKVTSSLPLSEDVDLERLAFITNGYVGADLVSVAREAVLIVILGCKKERKIKMDHFEQAVRKVMPSIRKGTVGLVELSPVQWSQIGGLSGVKGQIQQAVEWPIKHPEAFQRMGLPCPKGVLLYGPPGCCKTTLVRAAATSVNATFISLSGAQLYSPYVGDSERLINEVFQKARAAAPSIIFLDEIDSIVGKRSESSSNRGVQERVLSSLLNEMDGIGIKLDDKLHTSEKVKEGDITSSKSALQEGKSYKTENRNVLLVAATNRPDLLDDALVRPGRIDRILYVPPPDEEARFEIFKVYTKKMPLKNVNLEDLSKNTNLFSGADLQNLCREAALHALTDSLESTSVSMEHFRRALLTVEPSLTETMVEKYTKMLNRGP